MSQREEQESCGRAYGRGIVRAPQLTPHTTAVVCVLQGGPPSDYSGEAHFDTSVVIDLGLIRTQTLVALGAMSLSIFDGFRVLPRFLCKESLILHTAA